MRWSIFLLLFCLAGCAQQSQVLKDSEPGGLFFLDAKHGWIVGSEVQQDKVFVASTSDGGKSWDTVRLAESKGILSGVAFQDQKCGWAVGSHALAFSTEDGGQSWKKDKAAGDARALRYRQGVGCVVLGAPGFSHRDGFWTFAGSDQSKGTLQTRDGNWLFHPADVQILDSQNLWGSDSTTLYQSVDGGRNWKMVRLEETTPDGSTVQRPVRASFFLSPLVGWLALDEGQFLTTTDGAVTRQELSSIGLEGLTPRQLCFFDAQTGIILTRKEGPGKSDQGKILTTSDGGKTWKKKLDLGEGEWREFFVLDQDHGWVVGRVSGDTVVRAFDPS